LSTRRAASERNYSLTGRRIGVQTWAISPKIREVDQFLRAKPEAREKIREIHPEVLFWALNGRRSMSHKKSHRAGFEERVEVLRRCFTRTDNLVREALSTFPRNVVARDDILDASAAAVTALLGNGALATIPEQPERDAFGLPMEMVYHGATPPHLTRPRGTQVPEWMAGYTAAGD
jgi:predicted RNase H-like nuclease